MKLVVQTGCFVAAAVVLVAAPKSGKTDLTEVFFTNASVPSLQIELDAAARAALLQEPRAYVRGTVKESGTGYQDVGVHLKGQYGTFQTVDGRPSKSTRKVSLT